MHAVILEGFIVHRCTARRDHNTKEGKGCVFCINATLFICANRPPQHNIAQALNKLNSAALSRLQSIQNDVRNYVCLKTHCEYLYVSVNANFVWYKIYTPYSNSRVGCPSLYGMQGESPGGSVSCQSHVSLLPVSCQSPASLLPVSCQSPVSLMSVSCLSHPRQSLSLMPVSCLSHVSLLSVSCLSHISLLSGD